MFDTNKIFDLDVTCEVEGASNIEDAKVTITPEIALRIETLAIAIHKLDIVILTDSDIAAQYDDVDNVGLMMPAMVVGSDFVRWYAYLKHTGVRISTESIPLTQIDPKLTREYLEEQAKRPNALQAPHTPIQKAFLKQAREIYVDNSDDSISIDDDAVVNILDATDSELGYAWVQAYVRVDTGA